MAASKIGYDGVVEKRAALGAVEKPTNTPQLPYPRRNSSAGETRHFHFGPGEFLLRDIENIGQTELVFTTVEHLDSDNTPLDI